jgi:hypothetical protein
MQQADSILARFPEPVTLYVSRRRKLIGLVIFLGFTAFLAWLVFAEYPRTRGYLSRPHDTIMSWFSMLVCCAFSIRAVILLLFPDTASLMLDADGFRIGHVFHSIRKPWRGVSEFRVGTTPSRSLIGRRLEQIAYDDLAASAERGGATVTRILPDLYGRPRLHGYEFALLMNEWRSRALAQAERPPEGDARKSALLHLRRYLKV